MPWPFSKARLCCAEAVVAYFFNGLPAMAGDFRGVILCGYLMPFETNPAAAEQFFTPL